eukprot:CAMPEP_0203789454 /NCGR_PEP_ID=MMETSP0100_2-20121128/3454_1 /ASSEMBLY_ACC=CAM_ASM_000210 /TAXON_ID=96639 /ORGANISM=" , Strain NY0313808BC1" /LENGTH=472 /DNA_ID=CAMNT_0050692395 /DNA_START=456 /DNA_END=1874 /DNA_ORIENTATION=+
MSISGQLGRLRRNFSRQSENSSSSSETSPTSGSNIVPPVQSTDNVSISNQEDSRIELDESAVGLDASINRRRLKSHNSASGMSQDLRKTIKDVQLDKTIPSTEKARRIQELMTFSWRQSQERQRKSSTGSMRKRTSSAKNLRRFRSVGNMAADDRGTIRQRSQSGIFSPTNPNQVPTPRSTTSIEDDYGDIDAVQVEDDDDIDTLTLGDDDDEYIRTYHDEDETVYGCEHYMRNCMISAPCCGQFFPCRFCHDEEMDHEIDRYAVDKVRCMRCGVEQGVAKNCKSCDLEFARYFCEPCKFYDNKEDKQIYHCPHCNICRIGEGLGIDYFHCHRCNACMSITLREHKCVERSLESDCPVCHEFMFTSTIPVMFLPCGHCMHVKCYEGYTETNYICPICGKSLGDMAAYFKRIDEMLANERMPEEYKGMNSLIFCADCEDRSVAPYHFVYHKCKGCGSYNTKVLEQLAKEQQNG